MIKLNPALPKIYQHLFNNVLEPHNRNKYQEKCYIRINFSAMGVDKSVHVALISRARSSATLFVRSRTYQYLNEPVKFHTFRLYFL